MAKLYYRHGAMGSGKSLDLLKVADNYERKGRKVLVLTPSADDRHGKGVVSSRVGLFREAMVLYERVNTTNLVSEGLSAVLVDEAQFLPSEQVQELAEIADCYDISVIAYGLKNDFKNELFEGSAELLVQADSIEEIKTVCHTCDRKAIMNLRYVNGEPARNGEQVVIGDEQYFGVCRKCYYGAFNYA